MQPDPRRPRQPRRRQPLSGWLLAADTATDALSVAVGRDGDIRFSLWQRRRRGHAEALVPLMGRALAGAGLTPNALDGVAVSIGPGAFTGIRIALAAARGLRLAVKLPVIGVNTLELLAFQAARQWPERPVLAALDARRGQVYAQLFRRATPPWPETWSAPAAMSAEAAAAMLPGDGVLAGSGATLVAEAATGVATEAPIAVDLKPDAAAMLALLATRPLPDAATPPPAPLYLRAPDAVPAQQPAVVS